MTNSTSSLPFMKLMVLQLIRNSCNNHGLVLIQKFFGPDESHLIKDFQVAGDELLKVLDQQEQQDLRVNMDSLKDRYQVFCICLLH